MNRNEQIEARKQQSLIRWRLRERQKEALAAAGVSYTQSPNAGIVYVDTGRGRACYKLVSGKWVVPGVASGQGAANLKLYLEKASGNQDIR